MRLDMSERIEGSSHRLGFRKSVVHICCAWYFSEKLSAHIKVFLHSGWGKVVCRFASGNAVIFHFSIYDSFFPVLALFKITFPQSNNFSIDFAWHEPARKAATVRWHYDLEQTDFRHKSSSVRVATNTCINSDRFVCFVNSSEFVMLVWSLILVHHFLPFKRPRWDSNPGSPVY